VHACAIIIIQVSFSQSILRVITISQELISVDDPQVNNLQFPLTVNPMLDASLTI